MIFYVANITWGRYALPCWWLVRIGRQWLATEFGRFCRGELQNFVSWPVEFGKIFRGKLLALVITH